eukprot:GHRR01006791.1.p2 GENE.GHRR01006791.1~~GHRR01006791.1.p2  ORF type:complete len:107 (+),score=34.06 GHRR01006791.1:362-682(+)
MATAAQPLGSSVQDTIDRVSRHKGVLGLIVVGNDGSIYQSTLEERLAQEYAAMIPSLTALARNVVRELDPQNDMEFLRIRSNKQEIMVAAKSNYVLIVIQEALAGA